ncbi:MAG: glycosyltransferase family 39 protein [bacterium]|nr:glycosyltransferase family 39 protein [bacterium]
MKKYLLSFLLSVLFLLAGILTLSDYGINWDSPLHMLRGQAYREIFFHVATPSDKTNTLPPNLIYPWTFASRYYFASVEQDVGERKKVGLPQRPLPQKDAVDRSSFYHHPVYSGEAFKKSDSGHMPLINIMSAMTSSFFWETLHWLGDIESYQLIYILISAVGVFVVTVFTFEITGSYMAAVVAGFALGLFPLFIGESHINAKDPEQAVFFTGAVWTFYQILKQGTRRWWVGFFLFLALALSVKWNIVFLPFIVIPWLFLIRKTEAFKAQFRVKRLAVIGGIGILGILLFLTAIWPYAWTHPIASFVGTFTYYMQIGIGTSLIQPSGFIFGGMNIYPFLLFLTQTPDVILLLLGIGIIGILRTKGGDLKVGYLLLFWFFIPIIRLSVPGTNTYGGLRQIMEILPAIAVLAGVGAWYLIGVMLNLFQHLKQNKIPKPSRFAFGEQVRDDKFFVTLRFVLNFTICTLLFALLVFPIIRLHPNENAYFNVFVGGLKGAKEKGLIDWTLTYGNIYKQAATWLNQHAEKNANIAHLDGSMFALSPLWLRSDISISPYHFSGFGQKGEYIVVLYNPLDPPVFAKRYPERFLRPIHTVDVDGVALLTIYKNDPKDAIRTLGEEKALTPLSIRPVSTPEFDYWEVDLGRDYLVTHIDVASSGTSCNNTSSSERLQDEAILFTSAEDFLKPVDLRNAYTFNEKEVIRQDIVRYFFAGDTAKLIRIFPQNNFSCFSNGKIVGVYGYVL